MEKNGFERTATELASNGTLSHLNGAYRQERSVPEGQQLNKEVGQLRLEAEYSGEWQEAFQRIPQSDETAERLGKRIEARAGFGTPHFAGWCDVARQLLDGIYDGRNH